MKLTKFDHSCIRLTHQGRVLVLDPGVFSDSAAALDGADVVLVTHEHPDHLDRPVVLDALRANAVLRLFGPKPVIAIMAEEAGHDTEITPRLIETMPESHIEIPGFSIRTFGGQHALIHPHVPMVANMGFLINEDLYHPGDSFIVPHGIGVTTLLVPVHAPWSKIAEVIDFVIAVRAPRAFQVHDGLLNERGLSTIEGHVRRIGGHYGTDFEHLATGRTVQL